MYLHLGQDRVVNDKEIIGIFDMDSTTVSKITREFLSVSERKGEVINVGDPYELPKSFTVVKDKNGKAVYISQLAVATLEKRAKTGAGAVKK